MPKHTFMSAKLSANTAIFFQTVNWTVFLCNVCLGCPKTEAHFCQNAQMSFLVAFFPPVPFLFPLSLLSSSMAPRIREFGLSGLESVEPANCRQNDFCLQHVAGAWALGLPFRRGTVLWRSHTFPGSLCLLHGNICAGCSMGMPDSKEKAINTGFKLLKK